MAASPEVDGELVGVEASKVRRLAVDEMRLGARVDRRRCRPAAKVKRRAPESSSPGVIASNEQELHATPPCR